MYCCIKGCSSTTKDNNHKLKGVRFYYFPAKSTLMPWLSEKRQIWINAVKKHTRRPDTWLPTRQTTICSTHFFGNKKSENPLDSSYIPTIFPNEETDPDKLVKTKRRRMKKPEFVEVKTSEKSFHRLSAENNVQLEEPAKQNFNCHQMAKTIHQHQTQQAEFVDIKTFENSIQEISPEHNVQFEEPGKQNFSCNKTGKTMQHQSQTQQAEFVEVKTSENSFQEPSAEYNVQPEEPDKQSISHQSFDSSSDKRTYKVPHFFCNLINSNDVCTPEISTNMVKKIMAESCEANIPTATKAEKDFRYDHLDQHSEMQLCPGFHGISPLTTDKNLISLTGVTFAVFNLLLKLLPDCGITDMDKRTKILITLMKLKTGLHFSVLSVIFQIKITTICTIFENYLFLTNAALKKFIIWPSKLTVQASMPEPFKLHFANTRVIIDCAEIHTEYPTTVKQRVHMYSNNKHDYTIKFLVGCTPCGFISFVSKAYGGRSSEGFIANDCGIIDLLDPGDAVFADKGFSSIKTCVENKKAVLVMPPFRHEPQFLSQEVEKTYKIASMSIYMERIMQSIKQYHIFDKLPLSLMKYRDEIIFVVCALVNVENENPMNNNE